MSLKIKMQTKQTNKTPRFLAPGLAFTAKEPRLFRIWDLELRGPNKELGVVGITVKLQVVIVHDLTSSKNVYRE